MGSIAIANRGNPLVQSMTPNLAFADSVSPIANARVRRLAYHR